MKDRNNTQHDFIAWTILCADLHMNNALTNIFSCQNIGKAFHFFLIHRFTKLFFCSNGVFSNQREITFLKKNKQSDVLTTTIENESFYYIL